MENRRWHAQYDEGVPPSLAYEEVVLGDVVARAAARWPTRDALVFLNCRMTYARLADQVDRLATALTRLGVRAGSKVAVHLPNMPQTAIAFLAVQRCGALAVMTNPLYVPREIEHQWNDAGCEVAITADFLYERSLRDIRDALPIRHYIVASIPEYLAFPLKQLAPLKLRLQKPKAIAAFPTDPDVSAFRKLIDSTPPDPPSPSVSFDDVAVLQYTGGTTGVSKAAALTHRNLVCNIQQCRVWMGTLREGDEVVLAALPFFHIFGLTICLGLGLWMGATIVVMPNPRDIHGLVKAIAKRRVTLFPGVPAMFHAINTCPGVGKVDLGSVKGIFSGSAPLQLDTMRAFEKLTGGIIIEGFGLTETSPVSHINPMFGTRKPGSVGVPLPDTDARIVDMNDPSVVLPANTEGELALAGPQVMQGYWNRPDETALVLKDGWLLTGDLAVMDDDGYFRIVGRKKDMIVAGGYNIYPDEVDRVLTDHPDVLEAATIGIPDPKRGETVKSFIVLREGATLDEEGVRTYCRGQLARYKVPRYVEFRSELPKSAMMKLLRRTLRDEEVRKMESSG
ncbi:MAG: long-chain fatty acid--CoA ligase [Planctomycetes bacterium]|nr:long-chain fatty acid--CoA ligase [Planctomycetota bacterium]